MATCPLAAALLATAVNLLVATSAISVAAADKYSGRMVIIRAPGARVLDDVSADGALNKWQNQRRLVEDEVAPELAGGLLRAGDPRASSYGALDQNRPVCLRSNNCPASHGPYTGRPCASFYGCNNTPSAGHARAVHV